MDSNFLIVNKMPEEHEGRVLTDSDIKALADDLEGRLIGRFYNNLGHGVWDLIWRLIITALFALAAWGAWLEMRH